MPKVTERRGRARLLARLGAAGVIAALLVSPAAADARRGLAYVTNRESSSVSVIDTATRTVVATVPVGTFPTAVAITPDGTRAYVAAGEEVWVIDTSTNTVVARIGPIPGAKGLAISPDGALVYVTEDEESGRVAVIDTSTNSVLRTIPVGVFPQQVALTPDGLSAYVSNYGVENLVSAISTSAQTVTGSVPVATRPDGLAVAPDGALLYVATPGETGTMGTVNTNSVAVINTATDTVAATVTLSGTGSSLGKLAITADGRILYAAFAGEPVFAISTLTDSVVATLTGTETDNLALMPGDRFLYVTHGGNTTLGAGHVSIIDTESDAVVATVPVGREPGDVAFTGMPTPEVETTIASGTTASSATLEGTVNPLGKEVIDCRFEYGTTETYGSSAPCDALPGSGNSPVAVSASISSLGADTTYHFRLLATNEIETAVGDDHTFKTGIAPGVAKLSPKKGPAAGGTQVTITGTGFTGVTAVRFGATPAASYTVLSSKLIVAVSPRGTTGPVNVTVTTPQGTSTVTTFTYGAPTIESLSISAGPKSGGTPVAITGSGFAAGNGETTFLFGKTPATAVECASSSTCTATAPAAAKTGAVNVIAIVSKKKSKKVPSDQYTYE